MISQSVIICISQSRQYHLKNQGLNGNNVAGIHPIQINTINIKNLTIYHTLKTPKNTWFITLITHIFSNFMQTLLDSKPNQMRLGRYAFLPLMSGKYINGSHKSLLFLEHKNDQHLGPDMDSLPCCSFQFVNEIPIMLSQNLTIQKVNQQFSLKYNMFQVHDLSSSDHSAAFQFGMMFLNIIPVRYHSCIILFHLEQNN